MSAETLRRLDDGELGAALARLDLRWHDAPDVAADIVETVRAADRMPTFVATRVGVVGRRRTLLLIAAALALLVLVGFAARAVIHVGAISIERIEGAPTVPGPVFPDDAGGTGSTLDEARASLQGEPVFPSVLGAPDRIWIQEADPAGTSATMAWIGSAWAPSDDHPAIPGTRWGAVFLQSRGDIELITKQIGIAGALREVDVDGSRGVWLDGPHDLLLDDEGRLVRYGVRGNVLIWSVGDRTYRLETAITLEQALATAATVG